MFILPSGRPQRMAMPWSAPAPAFALLALLVCSGCIHNNAIRGPEVPLALQISKNTNQDVLNEVRRFYDGKCIHDQPNPVSSSLLPAHCGSQEEQRNAIIYDLKNIIDSYYESYSRNIEQTADTTAFAAEVGAASLVAVSTLVGTSELKDILTTASALTQSTNVSIQKNFYQKQTVYVVLAEMDADRTNAWSNIVVLMKQGIGQYPLSAALNDLREYKSAGTFTAAFTAMTHQAALKKDAASQQTNHARGAQIPFLRITMTHIGHLKAGQDVIYSITVSNIGQAATSGAVTVLENIPSGLALVSMAAPGWACANANCTRSDPLTAGSSYSVITEVLHVAAAPETPVVNQAMVSGGGSASSTATDSATIE